MKKAIVLSFILFLLLQIEAQAQPNSIMTGTVTEVRSRWLAIKTDNGDLVWLRVGYKTVYPQNRPIIGDKVRVEYSVVNQVLIGYSVAIIEGRKKEAEDRARLHAAIPPEGLAGKWAGSWDDRTDMRFFLTISIVNLQAAEVKYESKDLKFSETAKLIFGEKPKIEWTSERIDDYGGAPAPSFSVPRRYLVWYTCELQKDGTLEASYYHKHPLPGKSSGRAVLRKMD